MYLVDWVGGALRITAFAVRSGTSQGNMQVVRRPCHRSPRDGNERDERAKKATPGRDCSRRKTEATEGMEQKLRGLYQDGDSARWWQMGGRGELVFK